MKNLVLLYRECFLAEFETKLSSEQWKSTPFKLYDTLLLETALGSSSKLTASLAACTLTVFTDQPMHDVSNLSFDAGDIDIRTLLSMSLPRLAGS